MYLPWGLASKVPRRAGEAVEEEKGLMIVVPLPVPRTGCVWYVQSNVPRMGNSTPMCHLLVTVQVLLKGPHMSEDKPVQTEMRGETMEWGHTACLTSPHLDLALTSP